MDKRSGRGGNVEIGGKMLRIIEKKNLVRIGISAAAGILWLLFLWKGPGICFETNDDKFITEILSGAVTGEPEAHVVYVNYLLSAPLALLYRLMGQVPWYGGLLLLLHFGACAALFHSALSRGKRMAELIALGGLACCYLLLGMYMTAVLQYTSTAGLLAVCGYGCLLLHRERKCGLGWFVFFEFAAFLLRSQAMLMIQPFGAAAYMGLCLVERGETFWEKCRKAGLAVLLAGAVALVGEAGTLVAYGGEGWREFNRFNKARTELFDYYGVPDYEEVKFILDGHGVTEAQYEAFCGFVILDWDISVECAEELAAYAREAHPASLDVKALFRGQWISFRSSPAVQAAWGLAILWVLFFGRFRLCLSLAGVGCARVLVWGYLLYRGRAPERVTLPLLACEAFLLAALVVLDYVKEDPKLPVPVRFFAPLFFAAFLAGCVYGDVALYRRAVESNEQQRIYIEGLVELQEYCRSRPQERYLLDTWSMRFYNGSPLETRIYGRQNFVYTGSWFSGSPPMREALKKYLSGEDAEGGRSLCLIVADDGSGKEHCAVAYLTESLACQPELVEELQVSNGGRYLVWRWQ